MAKQAINVGTAANDKKGDSLRAAFQKVNANFTELYTALGLDTAPLNLGAFEFTGSTLSTTDSSSITIDQATTITSNLSVGGDILPQTANGGDLGSSTLPWRSLYVSNNTIYIGGTAVGVDANGNLLVGGQAVADVGTAAWNSITGKPTFAAVATTGAYADLTGKPTIPTDFRGSVFADDSTLMVDAVDNKIYATELTVAVGNFVNVNSNNVDVENINGLSSQINFTVGGYNNLVIENNLVTIQNVSLSVAGDITLGGNIRSEGNINIDINLADSTLRRWQFGEDGALTFPDGTSQSTAGGGGGSTLVNGAYSVNLESGGVLRANVQAIISDNQLAVEGSTLISIQTLDGPYLQLFNQGATKEINLVAWDGDPLGSSPTWSFDTDRTLTLPNDSSIKSATNIDITVDTPDSSTFNWRFGADGNLTLPQGGTIEEDGGISGAIKLTPSGGANAYQALLIYPTAGGDGDHIHLTAGGGTTELYLGDDLHYVKLESDGNVRIQADNGVNGAAWGFGTDGSLQIPGDIRSEGNINIDINLADSTLRRWSFGEDGALTFPDGTSQSTALRTSQDESSVAIGGSGTDQAGGLSPQGGQAIAIGLRAARTAQGGQAIAIGSHAGDGNQGIGAVAIGTFAGATNQITNAIAIGTFAGQTNQGSGAIAIGRNAGFTGQAIRSIAIGDSAGKTDQHEGTIVLNSTGSPLDTDGTGRFYVASVRNSNSPSNIVYYNTTTKEITYGAPPTPTDIRSEGNINIDINLADSTLRRWQFGEDGILTLPSVGKISNGAYDWTFGTDGKLTAPGNLQVNGGKIILNTAGNAYIESVDYGVNSANSAVNIFGGPYQKINLRAGFGTQATWTFGTDGALTLPGDIKSNGNINIDINLADSTLRRWSFGEDGALTFPDGTNYAGKDITLPQTYGGVASKVSWNFSDIVFGNSTTFLEWNLLSTDFSEFLIGTSSAATPFYFSFDGSGQTLGTIDNGGIVGGGKLTFGSTAGNNAGDANAIELKATNGDVYLTSTESVKITVDANDSSARVWTFDPSGNLNVPGGIVAEYEEDFTISTSYLLMSSSPGTVTVTNTLTFAANGDLTVPRLILGTDNLTLRAAAGYTTSIEAGVGGTIEIGYQDNPPATIFIGTATAGYTTTVRIAGDRIRISAEVPTSSKGQSGDVVGQIAFSSTHIYYCTASYDGTTDIWKRVALTGGVW